MPSASELMVITGFRSTHAASTLVEGLVDHALLEHDVPGKLLPGHLLSGLPVLSAVVAGFPHQPMKS
jgi:hypothetical protein